MASKQLIYITGSVGQTRKLGALLAKAILANAAGKSARVLALSGNLGAGKTHFAQGFAFGLGIKGTIGSPTFAIMKKYPLGNQGDFKTFYHIDCYRLESGDDLRPLGIENILSGPNNIIAIEWPRIAQAILPKGILKITFEVISENKRRIEFYG
ncbi:MAG: tRNA (adenosine(37)-N6)-threonylcarbamoyltransferase complex ATPase subunit type 1 TsaE [Minisyncoccales bacterium]